MIRPTPLKRFQLQCLVVLATPLLANVAYSACEGKEFRAFDFWIGDWDVYAGGKLAGHNNITREYGGCVIHEHYSTARGYSGESFNIFDATRGVWHQSWVDTDGLLLLLDGHSAPGKMTLEGKIVDNKQQTTWHRITWTLNPDKSVRQLWETATKPGEWTVAFDGKYVKK